MSSTPSLNIEREAAGLSCSKIPTWLGREMNKNKVEMAIRALGMQAENHMENYVFGARWMLAPAYLVLIACLMVLAYKTFEEFIQLISDLRFFAEAKTISQVLTIVDLILVMNLVLMVLFVGYVNFVSRIHPPEARQEDWPEWMEYLDYSGLKIQLLGSIIAVSAILILRFVVDLAVGGAVKTEQFIWLSIFHGIFLASVLTIAVVNRLKAPLEHTYEK